MVEIFPTSEENPVRLTMEKETIAEIAVFDPITGEVLRQLERVAIFPISYFFYNRLRVSEVIPRIREELDERLRFFRREGKPDYAERLSQRTLYDLEMLEQFGFCPGIENYSYYLSGRCLGEPPCTLLDFFPRDYLMIIDESHITVPQVSGMYGGDRSRKLKLVEYGFRLPTALENRPLNFAEFRAKLARVLYVSATPAAYEIQDSRGQVRELLVRPTGLLDPALELRTVSDPVADLILEIQKTVRRGRVLVTTLTKKMAEKLSAFLSLKNIRCTYLHSEIKTLDRVKILKRLRAGEIDVLIGINLLREGLDLPEVCLVVILDADKEGFLRSTTSLIQTFGRAARHVEGRVLLYGRSMTGSLSRAMAESQRRRQFQMEYNQCHDITPASIRSPIKDFSDDDYWIRKTEEELKADFRSEETLKNEIERLTVRMKQKATALDFKGAAQLRDRITYLKNLLLELA